MLIALNLIQPYLDRPLTAQWVQHALTHSGFVVEHIHDTGSTQVLDVELTSNRPDCQSHIGIARELAVLSGGTLQIPPVAVPQIASRLQVTDAQVIDLAAGALCPYYSATVIKNVKVAPSPDWLIGAIESLGLRSVNNVVDITNYVLMLTGQPLHAFDRDRLHHGPVVIRTAREGEIMRLINGQEVRLSAQDLLIADSSQPLALAGIMGGVESEITSDTTHVLLESAQFVPTGIARTSRRLNIASDSSRRFERGIDPAMVIYARQLAAQMIANLCGGIIETEIDRGTPTKVQHEIRLRLERFSGLVGSPIDLDTAMNILRGLEFAPRNDGPHITCTTPSFRFDISREVDLIEELVRIWGYEKVPVRHEIVHVMPPPDDVLDARRAARRLLTGAGWFETVSYTFVDPPEADLFLPTDTKILKVQDAVRKANNVLRPSLLPGLLATVRHNQNMGEKHARFFEIAAAFCRSNATGKAVEIQRLAMVGADVSEVTGAIDLLIGGIAAGYRMEVVPKVAPGFAPGASGKVLVQNPVDCQTAPVEIGAVGQLGSQVIRHYDLRHKLAAAELDWPALVSLFTPIKRAETLPRFPAVRRDLSIVVAEAVKWSDIQRLLQQSAGRSWLEEVQFVGVYRGKPIEADKKSVTMELIFRDANGSLESAQVDADMQRIVAALEAGVGGELRR